MPSGFLKLTSSFLGFFYNITQDKTNTTIKQSMKYMLIIQILQNCNIYHTTTLQNAQVASIATRMVQLPATTAIEYVAACWVSGAGGIFVQGVFFPGGHLPGGTFGRGDFCPGVLLSRGLLAGGTFVRGAYARSPQVQCIYTASRHSVPSIVA